MTQLNELINKHIDSIKFNGCQLSKEMLTLMFDGVVAMAKIQESFEINQKYLESIGTAFGNGGNDQTEKVYVPNDHLWANQGNGGASRGGGVWVNYPNKPVEAIGQHITEPESIFIQPNEMVKGKWYVALSIGHNWKWLFKYDCVEKGDIVCQHLIDIESNSKYMNARFARFPQIKDLRPATIEEVTKFFPNEFDSNVTEHPNKY